MRLLLCACLIALTSSSFAQTKNASAVTNQSFYAELGGPGILFSANYDRRFGKSSFGFGGRIGAGFVPGYREELHFAPYATYYRERRTTVLTVPVQINYLFGKPTATSAFEVGLGATFAGKNADIFYNNYDDKRNSVYGTASFMYRRMPKEGGFSWRLGFTPIFASGLLLPSAAASVGYNF